MNMPKTAKGNKKRQENKGLRRAKILNNARALIAKNGFDAFTLSELAKVTDISIPTIHNLFGKKHDIFQELVEEMVTRIATVISTPDLTDPIEAAIAFIDSLLALFKNDETFYRAAFVAGERLQLFEHESPDGIFKQALNIAEQLCQSAKENGFLCGDIDSHVLAQQILGCQRLARQDWMNNYIDIEQYRTQVLVGMFVIFSADANTQYKSVLQQKINTLT